MGVVVDALAGGRDPDHIEEGDGPLARSRVIQPTVRLEPFGDLAPDRENRVQARQRILKDHPDPCTADSPKRLFRQPYQLTAFEANASGRDAPDALREQAEQRKCAHAFSRA